MREGGRGEEGGREGGRGRGREGGRGGGREGAGGREGDLLLEMVSMRISLSIMRELKTSARIV